MAVLARVATIALLALLATPLAARAHPIHTTLTVVTFDPRSGQFTLSIRAFADDFSAAVARAAGRTAPRDSSLVALEAERYVRERVTVAGAELVPCGIERRGESYVLCFRASVADPGAATMKNTLLTELHADQVNVVQVAHRDTRRTHVFTAKTAALKL
jgi:hypothetical protein